MERRFLLAVSLMIAVLVVPSLLLKRSARPVQPRADSTAVQAGAPRPAAAADTSRNAQAPSIGAAPAARPDTSAAAAAEDTLTLALPDAIYRFSARGGTMDRAVIPSIRDLHHKEPRQPVQLVRSDDHLLARRIVAGADTLRLDNVPFSLTSQGDGIEMTGRLGGLTETVRVRPVPGHPYLLDVTGEFNGLEGRGALLVIGLGNGLANVEADSMDNYRNYAVTVRRGTPENTNFRSVNEGVTQTLAGPFDWVGVKSKYFMGAVLSADSARPQFGGALLLGRPREGRLATTLQTVVTMPVGPDGRYHYQFYMGPQTFRTLRAMGRDMDRASSYGWIFKPIVMPAAAIITRLFMWMHANLHLSYGMVLIVFGVLVRLVLWPLNQKAMKSQVAMMAIQPVLKDIQTRYKNDPQKLQQEMMKTYKEHNVNPLGGCLPMLIPMPVLLALFFVFNRAMELRGTPFLWIPDLSLRDPLFITPIVMGLSMFVLSKLSQAGMPPNPQTKMMTTVMPVMMTFLFLNFASGLNLYYAVSNLVSLPQQFIINKSRAAEMARRQVSVSAKSG